MKKILLLLVVVMGFTAATMAAPLSDIERTAKNAASSCISNAKEGGYEMVYQTQTISSCFAGGFITEVTIFKVKRCTGNPNNPCPRPAAQVVAIVTIGCGGEASNVVCGF